jgi:hypothetical protein
LGITHREQLIILIQVKKLLVRQRSLFGIGYNVEITVTVGGSTKKAIANWILGPLVLGVTDIS